MSSRPILMMALSMLYLTANVARGELSLGELRTKFEVALESDGAEHAEKTLRLKEGYGGALERLKGTLGREGKLEQATQVLREVERIEADGVLVGLPDTADHRLKSLRKKWEEAQEKLDDARREKVAELARVYLKALDERKDALTRAGKIREALVVEEEAKRVGEMEIVSAALTDKRIGSDLRGSLGEGNLALITKGAKAVAPSGAEKMIDGNASIEKWASGYFPCEFGVELPKLHVVSKVRMLLPDAGGRRLLYQVEISSDGKNWSMVEDRGTHSTEGGWKTIKFDPKDVQFVRVKGLGNTANTSFHIAALEVYSP